MQVSRPPLITLSEVLDLAHVAKGSIHHIYLHWTAGRYHQFFDDYHLNIDADGQIYQTCDLLTDKKAHTYQRNSGAIGIALCCGYDASWNGNLPYFGSCPPNYVQLYAMATVVAILCQGLGLPISSDVVLTHGEAASLDGYGPGSGDPETRWDLFWVLDENADYRKGGPYLRELAQKLSDGLSFN